MRRIFPFRDYQRLHKEIENGKHIFYILQKTILGEKQRIPEISDMGWSVLIGRCSASFIYDNRMFAERDKSEFYNKEVEFMIPDSKIRMI